MERKWENEEEMEKEWENEEELERDSLSTFSHFLFISSLSFHFFYQKLSHFVANVKYGTFVANVTKNLPYALFENNSGSNSLRHSSASCEGLHICMKRILHLVSVKNIVSHLILGSKLTFAGCSGLQLLNSAMFIVHSELNYYMTQLQIFQKVEYGGGPIFKLFLKW